MYARAATPRPCAGWRRSRASRGSAASPTQGCRWPVVGPLLRLRPRPRLRRLVPRRPPHDDFAHRVRRSAPLASQVSPALLLQRGDLLLAERRREFHDIGGPGLSAFASRVASLRTWPRTWASLRVFVASSSMSWRRRPWAICMGESLTLIAVGWADGSNCGTAFGSRERQLSEKCFDLFGKDVSFWMLRVSLFWRNVVFRGMSLFGEMSFFWRNGSLAEWQNGQMAKIAKWPKWTNGQNSQMAKMDKWPK